MVLRPFTFGVCSSKVCQAVYMTSSKVVAIEKCLVNNSFLPFNIFTIVKIFLFKKGSITAYRQKNQIAAWT